MTIKHSDHAKDFDVKTRRSLLKRRAVIVSVTSIPGGGEMPWANASRGYVVHQDGQERILAYADVKKLAAE